MVISPILRGMFGLQTDAETKQVTLAPHVPADWTSFAIHNVRVGSVGLDFQYRKAIGSITLETTRQGNGDGWVEFSPAVSLRTEVVSVELNGRSLPFQLQPNRNDQHISLRFPVYGGPNKLVIRLKNDFGLAISNDLPPLGSASRGLRVMAESWNAPRNQCALEVSGRAGLEYRLEVWNPAQISEVEGANLTKSGQLALRIPAGGSDSYVVQKVTIHFGR
jgi:hypothetical protein